MKTILVTGANGFVGKYLISQLLKDKDISVVGVVRDGKDIFCYHERLKFFCIDDINGSTDWSDILFSVDTVVHLAARVHHKNENSNTLYDLYESVNVAGTKKIAEAALEAGVKKFIFSSSIKVNGEVSIKPFTEKDIPAPQGPYAISKWQAEQMLNLLETKDKMMVVSLRLPLIYGPGVKANFKKIVEWIRKKIPLPFLFVNNKRSFLFVGNFSNAIMKLIEVETIPDSLYLLSDDQSISAKVLIEKIAKVLDVKCYLFPLPRGILKFIAKIFGLKNTMNSLIESLEVNNSYFKKQLSWEPRYSFEEGINLTLLREN